MNTGVRQSAEAKNIFFISPEPGSTLQSIGLQQWSVPWLSDGVPLYSIQRVLGYGSYSCVCLAIDNGLASQGHANPLVALKRVPNVLADHRQAKLVLREIAVLRRIRHPNVLQLRSAFLQPSSVGQCRLIDGKLVHTAVDLYIATEFAEGGDLYSLKGNLSEKQVATILWNMLDGLRYLHSCGIWHRDIKSQNAFLFREQEDDGNLVWRVKLGDFGSSVWRGSRRENSVALRRGLSVDVSSEDEDAHGDGDGDDPGDGHDGKEHGVDLNTMRPMQDESDSHSQCSSYSNGNADRHTHAHHLLTRQVCTPCYRAPEVVMSRGKYTEAVDMWGLGCIFGELLSRMSYVGSTHNSKLRVAPLFAVRDFPSVTPMPGETFSNTKKELDALFKVIGTPSWRDIERVRMVEWRSYLETLPGRAPTVMRRFKHAGEVAIHLLTRLLEFDPARRLTCEEAMQHEYFADLRDDVDHETEDEMTVEKLSPAIERQLIVKDTVTKPIGEALEKLEDDLDEILQEDCALENQDFFSPTTQRLLAMLRDECDAVTRQSSLYKPKSFGKIKEKMNANESERIRKKYLVEDVIMDDTDYARERLSNVADTWAGRELDPSKFLQANRHGEWSEWSAERAGNGRRAAAESGWGVSSVDIGGSAEYAAAIRQQQMK